AARPGPGRAGAPPPAGAPPYRPRRLHPRGGLGEAYVADDLELPRQVALQQLRPASADRPRPRDRVPQEEERTARLVNPAGRPGWRPRWRVALGPGRACQGGSPGVP